MTAFSRNGRLFVPSGRSVVRRQAAAPPDADCARRPAGPAARVVVMPGPAGYHVARRAEA